MTDAPLLATHDLVVRYGDTEAVHGLSLEVLPAPSGPIRPTTSPDRTTSS